MNTVFLKIQGIDGTSRVVDVIGTSLRKLTKDSAVQDKQAASYRSASYNSAMKDIRRMEADRAKWNKNVANEISRTDKLLADNKVKEFKRAANESIRSLGQMQKASEQTARSSSNAFSSSFSGSFWGTLGSNITSRFIGAIASIPGSVKAILDEAVQIATERSNAFKGLESIANFKGVDSKQVAEMVKNFRLVKAGIVDIGDASTTVKNLLATNFTLDETRQLFERFSDSAAFGKQQALEFGEAIRSGSEGLKQGNSVLLDNMGLTKNLSVILKEMGKSEQDVMNITQDASVRMAVFKGILKETAGQVGDADKLMQGWTGTVGALTTAKKNLLAEIGNIIITNPDLIALIKLTTQSLDAQTASYQKAGSESKKNTASMVSDAAKLALETYIAAMKIKAGFLEAGNYVAAGMSSMVLAFQTALLILNKSINTLFIDPINFAIDKFNSLKNFGILGMSAQVLPDVPQLARISEDQSAADFEAQRLRFLWESVNKPVLDANKSAEALRKSFEDLRKETQKQVDLERMSKDPNSALFSGNTIGKKTPGIPETTPGGKTGKTSGKSKLADAGLKELVDNRTKAQFEQSLRNLSPSLKAQIFGMADKYSIPQALALAQIFSESSFNTQAVSPFNKNVGSSAYGLTQQLPATASRFLNRKVTGEQLKNNPDLALTAWGEYMSFLFKRYGDWELATLAYHQGEGTVDKLVALLDKGKSTEGFFSKRPKGKSYVQKIAALSGIRGKEQFQTSFESDAKRFYEQKSKQVIERFRTAVPDSVSTEGEITGSIDRRLTLNEEYIRSLRVSLGLESESADEADRYMKLVERRLNILAEISTTNQSEILRQTEELLELEVQFGILQKQNADAVFVAERRSITAKREEYDLRREILELEDKIANGGINDALSIQAAQLRDILDLRQQELDAVISINRSRLEISQKGVFSQNLADAKILEHLNSNVKSVTEAYADFKIQITDAAFNAITLPFDRLNEQLDKLPPVIRDVASAFVSAARDIVKAWSQSFIYKLLGMGSGQSGGNSGGGFSLGNLLSIFTGGGSGGIGGTPNFNPNINFGETFTPNGTSSVGGGSMWGGWNQIKADQSKLSGMFGGGSGGNGKFTLANGMALGAMGLTLIGGMIGGRAGNTMSAAGTGMGLGMALGSVVPGLGTVVGGLIGGIGGAIAGLFMGDPKRKVDKKENLPKLQQGFKDAFREFSDLIADVNALRTDPDSAMGRGRELRAAVSSGFGIEFQSKKYRKQAQNLIKNQLAAIDAVPGGLMEQLKQAVDRAKAAGERTRRILPEFADGGSVSRFFRDNFSGLVPGMYDRRDDKMIRVSGNEVVLTPKHWKPIAPYLSAAGVPGFADGGIVAPQMSASQLVQGGDINVSVELHNVEVRPDSYMVLKTETGKKMVVDIYKDAKKNREI